MTKCLIGIEVHVRLKTRTKLFCSCPNNWDDIPNINICPICLGYPGTLPILNKVALEKSIKAAKVLNCQLAPTISFDRKHYFYPDQPRGYQITQYQNPVGQNGYVELDSLKHVRIQRVHIEDDAGKSKISTTDNCRLVDYNRAGTPLIEIVTYPDFKSAQEVVEWLKELKLTLRCLDLSDCDMENGSLRVDVNVGGVHRVEIKNLNSFRSIKHAVKSVQENTDPIKGIHTMHWDEDKQLGVISRSKENAGDYRYIKEPDIPEFKLNKEWLISVFDGLKETPHQRRITLKGLGLNHEHVSFLVENIDFYSVFKHSIQHADTAAAEIAGLLSTELSGSLKIQKLNAQELGKLAVLLKNREVAWSNARKLLPELFESDVCIKSLAANKGFIIIADPKFLEATVKNVLEKNTKAIRDYRDGNYRVFGFLMGLLMKECQGKIDAKELQKSLKQALEE
jgi:aspartyl-tRNA(Asn)/glutamyl-tRNA(Gln) amidotransferase subunit B